MFVITERPRGRLHETHLAGHLVVLRYTVGFLGLDHLITQLEEDIGEGDLHRAYLITRTAQRTRIRQTTIDGMLHAPQLRIEHSTDRPRVHRAVSVTARPLVNRADVDTRSAPNAPQHLAAKGVGKHVGTTVIKENDVLFLRPVTVGHTTPHRVVRVHPFPGGRTRQQLEENLKVVKTRQHLLDADNRHQGVRQSQAHTAIALRLNDH